MQTFKKTVLLSWFGVSIAILIAGTIAAFVVRFKQLDGHTFWLGSGDQKPVLTGLNHRESFSRFYCQELNIADASGEGALFNAYVLPKAPVPSGKSYRQGLTQTTSIGPSRVSPPLVFNLHRSADSIAFMEFSSCSRTTELVLYRCEDESAAVAWETSGDNQRCKERCKYAKCDEGYNSCVFVANSAFHNDVFVLMLAAVEDSPDKAVSVQVNITRYPYDLSVHSATCLNVTDCQLPIDKAKTQAVVLEAPVGGTVKPVTLKTECVPRVSSYFAFYLGIPLAIVLAVSLFVFLPCFLLQKSLKRQSIELRVKRAATATHGESTGTNEHDGTGLLDNEHLNESWDP